MPEDQFQLLIIILGIIALFQISSFFYFIAATNKLSALTNAIEPNLSKRKLQSKYVPEADVEKTNTI